MLGNKFTGQDVFDIMQKASTMVVPGEIDTPDAIAILLNQALHTKEGKGAKPRRLEDSEIRVLLEFKYLDEVMPSLLKEVVESRGMVV